MKLYYKHFLLALILFLTNCRQDEEIITGDITGKIYIYDQYGKMVPDQSGVTLNLFHDTALLATALTDSRGQYLFENLPYGKYGISLEKNLFIQTWDKKTVYHAGGYSPTFVNYNMYEIPTYVLSLENISYYSDEVFFMVHLKFNGDTILPANPYGMPLRVFAGNSPEVSNNNYVSCGIAYLSDYGPENLQIKTAVYCSIRPYFMDQYFTSLKDGMIYLRLYPLASGQGFWINEYYPEALGPPSNVISFMWDELVPVVGNR